MFLITIDISNSENVYVFVEEMNSLHEVLFIDSMHNFTFHYYFWFWFQLEKGFQHFTQFYSSQHSGRKLNWLYHMSKGELVTNCFKNRYMLQVRIFFTAT